MAKSKQIKEDDLTPLEAKQFAKAEIILKRKSNKYRPIPKFKGGCKNC